MLWVREDHVNITNGMRYHTSSPCETDTDDLGTLYRRCVQEFGRCCTKVYIDLPERPGTPVGWVFHKRIEYDDSTDTYLREVWVSVYWKNQNGGLELLNIGGKRR